MTLLLWSRILILGALVAATALALWATVAGRE
jgi:hypothetical protein